jgi:hypothetical protein
MLRFGALDAASYDAPRFDDAELRRLEALVEVRIDRELTAGRQRGARLEVTSAGRAYEEQVGPQPEPELMVDADSAIAKFAHNAASSVNEAASRAFCSALRDAEPGTPLRRLWRMLAAFPDPTTKSNEQGV